VEGIKPNARLHKIHKLQIGGLRLLSGDFTASDQEFADHLLETQFPCCQPIMENTAHAIPDRTPTEKDWLVASEAVDFDKIRCFGFGSFKSAGEDDIFPALLKNGNFIRNTG
jgi:hypothetical protein